MFTIEAYDVFKEGEEVFGDKKTLARFTLIVLFYSLMFVFNIVES